MKTILCTFFACALFCAVDVRAQQTPPSGAAFIAVCKESMTLAVYDFNSCLRAVYPIACGRALGNKEKPGDMKTPEGLFSVQQIQDASAWTHDFGDGKGEIRGAYGSHFIRLKTPGHRGIGIHGIHFHPCFCHPFASLSILFYYSRFIKILKSILCTSPTNFQCLFM